jgi:Pvc16 N-terminal domain
MLKDLDKTLAELLKRELPSHLISSSNGQEDPPQVEISFATPDSQFVSNVKLPAIGLFLYDVRENLGLRNNEWSVEKQSNGTATKKRPSIRVDCSYLITAWPLNPSDIETEHLLLGEVMKVLLRYRKIPEAVLQGSLKNQELPLVAFTLRPSLLNSLGEFWQAIGGKPKATLNYTVTIAISVDESVESLPLVASKAI